MRPVDGENGKSLGKHILLLARVASALHSQIWMFSSFSSFWIKGRRASLIATGKKEASWFHQKVERVWILRCFGKDQVAFWVEGIMVIWHYICEFDYGRPSDQTIHVKVRTLMHLDTSELEVFRYIKVISLCRRWFDLKFYSKNVSNTNISFFKFLRCIFHIKKTFYENNGRTHFIAFLVFKRWK